MSAVSTSSSSMGLTILTWNLWVAPLVRMNPTQSISDIAKFIDEQDTDIVTLQEGLILPLFSTSHQSYLHSLLKHKYPHAAYSRDFTWKMNQGLMILSKYPLTDIHGDYDKRMPIHHMGHLQATVEYGEGKRLRVVTLHLTPNFEGHWKGPVLHLLGERDVPTIQQEQLAVVAESLKPYGEDWVVCGDYNFEEPSVMGYKSRHNGVTCPGGGREGKGNSIDHCTTPLHYTTTILHTTLSDHYPVRFTLSHDPERATHQVEEERQMSGNSNANKEGDEL